MTKPTWVFVAGTYRTGSTTHYQMVRDVVEGTDNGIGIGYHTENKLRDFDIDRDERYIVCKVFEYLPNGFRGDISRGEIIHRHKRLRAIVSVRDPRDMITSMLTRTKEMGKDFSVEKVATEEFPVWLGAVMRWVDLGPDITLVSYFEEFTLNRLREVRAIAQHLDIDLDDSLAKKIAARYSVQAIEKRKREFREKQDPDKREDKWLSAIPGIRFGSSGQWRTHLTPQEAQMVVEANQGFFERFGYEHD